MSHGGEEDLQFLTSETAQAVAETMAALATPSRVRILSRLAAGSCSVGELAADLEIAQPAVSQQLRVLRHLGLVVGARDGRHTIYALHDDHVRSLLTEAISHTEHLRLGLSSHPLEDAASHRLEDAAAHRLEDVAAHRLEDVAAHRLEDVAAHRLEDAIGA